MHSPATVIRIPATVRADAINGRLAKSDSISPLPRPTSSRCSILRINPNPTIPVIAVANATRLALVQNSAALAQ